MDKYFGIFTQRRTLLLLILYLFLSFMLMTLNDPFKLRGIRVVVLQGIAWMNQVQNQLLILKNYRAENQQLKRQLLELSLENQQLQENILENIRLRRLLKFREESSYTFIPALVIAHGQEQVVRSLILNVGSADQVQKNHTVVTETGLVGRILEVESHQAITQILMDRNTLVSARLQRSREVGVISWSGNLWLDLNYIPRDVDVEPGEVVITSGLSRIYPRGIKIGIVAEIEEREYELFKQIKVKPAVNFNQLEEVFVLLSPDTINVKAKTIE